MTRTYIDSGILIAAARGQGLLSERALSIISDTVNREFVCSDYVRLEVLPKPAYFGRREEVRFYETFFELVSIWPRLAPSEFEDVLREACAAGLSSIDAIHVYLAHVCGCDELITSEKPASAIHRTQLVRTVSIDTD